MAEKFHHLQQALDLQGFQVDCEQLEKGNDLLPVLRGSPADERPAAIDRVLRASVRGKLPGHAINDPSFLQPVRGMNAIGG